MAYRVGRHCVMAFLLSANIGLWGQRFGPPLTGIVQGDDGARISAVVTAIRIGRPTLSGRTETAIDGSFSLSGLTDGQYQLCVADKDGAYLDPCAWSTTPPTVTVAAERPISGYKLIVVKGVPLQVQINDPSGLLQASNTAKVPAAVIAGVVTARHTLQLLPMVSQSPSGRVHQAAVPAGRAVSVSLFGKGFAITDAAGNALDLTKGQPMQIQAASGQPIQPVVFNIVGMHP